MQTIEIDGRLGDNSKKLASPWQTNAHLVQFPAIEKFSNDIKLLPEEGLFKLHSQIT